MTTISFIGICSGDSECFLWREVSKEDKVKMVGEAGYQCDWDLEEEYHKDVAMDRQEEYDPHVVEVRMQRLYPGEVMTALGCQDGKKYKFTITAEEV